MWAVASDKVGIAWCAVMVRWSRVYASGICFHRAWGRDRIGEMKQTAVSNPGCFRAVTGRYRCPCLVLTFCARVATRVVYMSVSCRTTGFRFRVPYLFSVLPNFILRASRDAKAKSRCR
ncbi:unnamed protein product, partial [Scytosiphon promiscuus]